MLIIVATWAKVLVQAQGALHIRGDALGVLHGMLRFKAEDSVLNAIAGELAYLIAPLGLDLGAVKTRRQPAPRFLLDSLVDKSNEAPTGVGPLERPIKHDKQCSGKETNPRQDI